MSLLARHYGSFGNWRSEMLAATDADAEARAELDNIIGIGKAIAEELADFFGEHRNVELVDGLAVDLFLVFAEMVLIEKGGEFLVDAGVVGVVVNFSAQDGECLRQLLEGNEASKVAVEHLLVLGRAHGDDGGCGSLCREGVLRWRWLVCDRS